MAYIPHGNRKILEDIDEYYKNEELIKSMPESVQEKVREEQKRESDNSNKILYRLLAIMVGVGVGGYGYIIISGHKTNDSDNYRDNISSILINNGEVTINNDLSESSFLSNEDYKEFMGEISFHKEINNVEYEISYFDDKSLVIYTYDENDTNRKSVTNYIISNITVDENNNIYFDPNDLTEEGYQNYINEITNNYEQGVQRVREI